MMIGFNDGVFHALFKNDTDRHKREFLEPLRDVRFKAMEIHTRNEKNMDALINDVRVGNIATLII